MPVMIFWLVQSSKSPNINSSQDLLYRIALVVCVFGPDLERAQGRRKENTRDKKGALHQKRLLGQRYTDIADDMGESTME